MSLNLSKINVSFKIINFVNFGNRAGAGAKCRGHGVRRFCAPTADGAGEGKEGEKGIKSVKIN